MEAKANSLVQLGDILARFEAAGSVENLSFGERLKKLADSKTGLVLSSFDFGVQSLKMLLHSSMLALESQCILVVVGEFLY